MTNQQPMEATGGVV